MISRWPQFRHPLGYHRRVWDQGRLLLDAETYSPVVLVTPEDGLLGPRQVRQHEFRLPPATQVWGFAAYASDPDGFEVEISEPEFNWLNQSIRWDALAAGPTPPQGIKFPLHLLPAPRPVTAGRLIVTLRSRTDNPQQAQLAIYAAITEATP
ncbi:MAG: hypothetical protein NZ765_09635 [Anaerolineae bacterium]|nr:hypothetical protein [Anaerolineae bacterium]MDW8071874.1 hypothetical protein [Anaerolineae bacterium]